MSNVWIAFGLTLFAGMATGIGSVLAFATQRTNYRFLSVSTGFSAGVMLYVSFVEIFYKGVDALVAAYGPYWGHWANAASFFGGILLIGLIDNLIPSAENPHDPPTEQQTAPLHDALAPLPDDCPSAATAAAGETAGRSQGIEHRKLMRMGLFTALAIAIHNFPEGLATFLAALQDPGLGLAIAVAIALHNIPEGISVAVPIYYATRSRKKAFWLSFLSGLAEPVGAVLGYFVLRVLFSETVFGIVFAAVGGIMVFISLDELLPAAREYGEGHVSIYGLVLGMALMAVSLLLLA